MNYKTENQLKLIGNNLYLARKAQDLTMQDVAERTGLCRQTVSDVEAGNGNISLSTYLLVADAVGVSLESDIRPQVLLRQKKQISMLDGCHGITETGIPFVIKTRKRKDFIDFSYKGSDYTIEFPHSDPGMTTKGKSLYLFAAGSMVTREAAHIDLQKDAERFRDAGNIRSQT